MLIPGCQAENYSEQIKNGIANGVQIGTDLQQVVSVLGQPAEQRKTDNGTIWLIYGDTKYAFQKDSQKLAGIFSHSKDNKICGVKTGMSFADAKAILGDPGFEGPGANTNERNGWIIDYQRGDNVLILSAKSEHDPINTIILINIRHNQGH